MLGAPAAAQETLYLTNTFVTDDMNQRVTELYLVTIDELAGKANADLIATIDLEQVDALACSPDDTICYLIDKYDPLWNPDGGQYGAYDMLSGDFVLLGNVVDSFGDRVPGIVQAGYSPGPEGQLYIASQETHYVYTLDVSSGIASPVGMVVVDGTSTVVDLEGADLAFASNGDLFIWANWANGGDAPAGLYSATLPGGAGDIVATYLGTGIDGTDPTSHFFTGVAIRNNGLGDFVAVNRFDELHEQAHDGTDTTIYALELDGAPLGHFSGDMHHSYDCHLQIELDRDTISGGESIALSMDLVHNRPQTVSVPFVLWIENAAGQIVFEKTSKSRTFVWGEEFQRTLSLPIPANAPAGTYTVYVGVNEMRQGEAVANRTFTVE